MGIEGPLKSSQEIAKEKIKSMEEKEARTPLQSAKEIAMEKAERMLAEAESKKEDIKKMEEIAKEYGLDVNDTIEAKKAEIANIEAADGYREIKPEEIGGPAPETDAQEKTKLEDIEAADGYQEISGEEMEAKEKEIRAEKAQEQPVAEIQPEVGEESEAVREKTLSEKNDEEMAKYFSKEETTGVKNYDAQDNEIIEAEKQQTVAEKNQEEINKYFSPEETTGVKTFDKDGNEMVAESKTPEEIKDEAAEKPKDEEIVERVEAVAEKPKDEVVAEKAEAGKEKPATAEERAKIQKEALEDFSQHLKKSDEAKNIDDIMSKVWSLRSEGLGENKNTEAEVKKEKLDNVVDIASARREKLGTARNIRAEKPATAGEREKVLMEAVADFRKELKGKKRLQKMFEKVLDLLGVGNAEVPEAKRIDRIMRGDTRTDEAVKIDEIMGKAKEAGDAESREMVKMKLDEANSMDELIHALDGIESMTNKAGDAYRVPDQQAYIDKLFKTGNPKFLNWITRAEDLRKNVKRVFDAESAKKENKKQAVA